MYKKRKELSSTAWLSITNGNSSYPPYPILRDDNEFQKMTLSERAHIVRLSDFKKFNPQVKEPSKKFKEKYSQEWWDNNIKCEWNGKMRNMDTADLIVNCCLFPQRCREDWKPEAVVLVDFYTEVTRDNALGWYEGCPPHLRARVDSHIATQPTAEASKPGESIYDTVKKLWGDRVVVRSSNEEGLLSSYMELEVYEEWVREYDRQVAIEACMALASSIQQERKMLNEAMGIDIGGEDFPMQSDGLDPTQAATIRWLQHQGQTPLEFLADTYKNGEAKMSDRITAARTLMEYIHRKIPSKQEIETKDVSSPKVDPKMLKGLSEKELDMLEKLLKKLGDGNG